MSKHERRPAPAPSAFPPRVLLFPGVHPCVHPPRAVPLIHRGFTNAKTRNSRGIHGLSTAKPHKNQSHHLVTPRWGSIYFYTTTSSCFILDSYQMRRYFQPHPQLWCSACPLGSHRRQGPSTQPLQPFFGGLETRPSSGRNQTYALTSNARISIRLNPSFLPRGTIPWPK